MQYYMKQKVFSWGDKFHIYDEFGNPCMYCQGEVFSWGKKLHLYDLSGNEVTFIHQKVFSFLPRFFISQDGQDIAEIVKEITFFRPRYTIIGPDWTIEGDLWAHHYQMCGSDGTCYVTVRKEWMSWGDCYEINVDPSIDPYLAVSAVLVVDAIVAQQAAAAASSSSSNS